MNKSEQYISVSYRGRNFMVVEGSQRHVHLALARDAFFEGHHDLAAKQFSKAIKAHGCAFSAREQQGHGQDDTYYTMLAQHAKAQVALDSSTRIGKWV